MRIVRYSEKNEEPKYGWVLNSMVGPIMGSPFGEYRRLEAGIPIEKVKLFPPVLPSKVIGIGSNFIKYNEDTDYQQSDVPTIHFKPTSAIIGEGQDIIIPPQSTHVIHEAELAVVIGKQGRWIKNEEVSDYIFGYTAANDVTAIDLAIDDLQWSRGKGFDTFCPLGPWIETELNVSDVLITCRVNDELRQMASSREFLFTVGQIIVFISSVMTLFPGDVILTGTPDGAGPIEDGDIVEIGIEGIGGLRNPVKKDSFTLTGVNQG